MSQISSEERLSVLWCAQGSLPCLPALPLGWMAGFVRELEREWPCCLLKGVGREGDSSGWERSSLPVTMRIVEEDSRELLREWKKYEPACISLVLASRLFPTRSVGGMREGDLGEKL